MTLIDVVGNATRLQILRELTAGPMYVTELAERVGMNGKTAVHHLEVLADAGMVEHFWEGNRKYYRLVRRVELVVSPPPEREFVLHADAVASETEDDWTTRSGGELHGRIGRNRDGATSSLYDGDSREEPEVE